MKEYTKDDEMYGEIFRDIRRDMRLINEELSQYSYKEIREFENNFPVSLSQSTRWIEVFCKEYCEEQREIAITQEYFIEQYSTEHILISTVEDFWERWNNFKKLRAFI